MARRYRSSQRLLLALLPPLVHVLLRALGVTWRLRITGREHLRAALASGRPVLAAGYHGRLLAQTYAFGRPQLRTWRVLISDSFDGELIARVARRMGFETARGSSGRRGRGDRGYRELVQSLRERPDLPLGFLVDGGGKGPRGHVKPGIVRLGSSARGLILPIITSSWPAWVARGSWDRFQVPKPFATVRIAFLPPLSVPPGAEGRERLRHLLEAQMAAAHEHLDRRVGLRDDAPARAPAQGARS